MVNRKLVRPNLAELKEKFASNRPGVMSLPGGAAMPREVPATGANAGATQARRRQVPPEVTSAEAFYYLKQMQAKTQLEQEALAAKALEAKETALANAAVAKARGEAEAIRIKGEALRANPQVLQQLAIEKWNGELPKVTGGSTPFVKID